MRSACDNIFLSNKLWFSNIQHKAQKFSRLSFALCLATNWRWFSIYSYFNVSNPVDSQHSRSIFLLFLAVILRISDQLCVMRKSRKEKIVFFCLEVVKNEHVWSVSMSNDFPSSTTQNVRDTFWLHEPSSLVTECVPSRPQVHFKAHICKKLTSFQGKTFSQFFFFAMRKLLAWRLRAF